MQIHMWHWKTGNTLDAEVHMEYTYAPLQARTHA